MTPIRPGRPVTPTSVISGKATVGKAVIVPGSPVALTVDKEGLRVWSGEGPPPPEPPLGIAVGDTYVDTLTGTIWRLDPGE